MNTMSNQSGSAAFDSANLKFPLQWYGRLVTMAATQEVEAHVREVYDVLGLDGKVEAGRVSNGGKYVSWQLNCEVRSLEELRELFARLEKLPGVRMLI